MRRLMFMILVLAGGAADAAAAQPTVTLIAPEKVESLDDGARLRVTGAFRPCPAGDCGHPAQGSVQLTCLDTSRERCAEQARRLLTIAAARGCVMLAIDPEALQPSGAPATAASPFRAADEWIVLAASDPLCVHARGPARGPADVAGATSAPVQSSGSVSPARRPPPPVYRAAPNTIFAEAMAAGALFMSLNYERRLPLALGVRAGVGSFSYWTSRLGGPTESTYWALPLTVSYQAARGRRSSLELGAGAILAVRSGCAEHSAEGAPCGGRYRQLLTAFAGYRRHPEDWGLDFRIGLAMIAGRGLESRSGDLTLDYEWQAKGAAFGAVPALYMSLGGAF